MNVPTGYTALDMIGFTDKGVYNSATAYVKNDIVHYNGNLWKCLVDDTTAVTPAEGASWTVFLAEPTSAAEDIIATVEPSVVSTHQYTAGKQLILNDILYTVTAAVNIGDTLAVGTNIVASDTIVEQLTTKANTSSLATVATSGSYADLSNKPTLGTAAAKDVPASGNASTTEVVMGDDTRLSDARNAADVYPWAKTANKPIYNGSEINTSAAQTGTAQSAVAATIASGTSMDAAIGDLLDNDVTINTNIGNVKQALSNEVATRATLGAHNLFNLEGWLNEKGVTYTKSGNSYTFSVSAYTGNNNAYKFSSTPITVDLSSTITAGTATNVGFRFIKNGEVVSTKITNGTIEADSVYIDYSTGGTATFTDVMLKLHTDSYSGFTPYVPTNAELLSADANAELGAHNFLRNEIQSQVVVPITFVRNADESVHISGTMTTSASAVGVYVSNDTFLKAGTYEISGIPESIQGGYGYIQAYVTTTGGTIGWEDRGGNKGHEIHTFTEDTHVKVILSIYNLNNQTFNFDYKPMIKLVSDSSKEYQPYAMTNRELTDAVMVNAGESYNFTDNAGKCSDVRSISSRRVGNILFLDIQATVGTSAVTSGSNILDLTFSGISFVSATGSSAVGNAGLLSRALSTTRIIVKAIGANVDAADSFNITLVLFLS